MEGIDKELEKRVWQRVSHRGAGEALGEEPCRMLWLARELASCYHVLAAKRGGQFRLLERQTRATEARVRTLRHFQGCREENGRITPPRGGVKELLERCCHLERRLAEALDGRRGDPEWGGVFALLAQEARKRCLTTLELRGRMEG